MRLNRLVIQGFKSFKDKTTIYFDQGITGIVGPNGCGKSNIVDALFWVMGEQSAKHLRGTSMKDLIFAGSSKYSPASFAEVTLVLDNTTHKHIHINGQVVKPSEIQLTRKLYRNGDTEYRINGEPARLKDIHEVFMDTGAGAKSYSIIAQGEINKLVQAKPEERRTMIEEVAGITKFKLRKKESLKKIEQTNVNLLRLEDLENEIYKNLKSLETQAEKADKARTLREKIVKHELIVESHKEFDFLTDFIELRKKIIERTSEHENILIQKNQIELSLEDEKNKKADLMDKLELAQEDFNIESKELAASEERIKNFQSTLDYKQDLIERMSDEKNSLFQESEDVSLKKTSFEAELENLKSMNFDQMDFSQDEQLVQSYKDSMDDLSSSYEEFKTKIEQKRLSIQSDDQELFKIISRIEDSSRVLSDTTNEIELIEKNTAKNSDELLKQKESLAVLSKKLQSYQEMLPRFKNEVEVAVEKLENLEIDNKNLTRLVFSKESKLSSLKDLNSMAEGKKLGAFRLKDINPNLKMLSDLITCHSDHTKVVEVVLAEFLDTICTQPNEFDLKKLLSEFQGRVSVLKTRVSKLYGNETLERLKVATSLEVAQLKDLVQVNDDQYLEQLNDLFSGIYVISGLTKENLDLISPDVQFRMIVSSDSKVMLKKVADNIVFDFNFEQESTMGIVQRNQEIKSLEGELELLKEKLILNESSIVETEKILNEKEASLNKLSQEIELINQQTTILTISLETRSSETSSQSSRLNFLHEKRIELSRSRIKFQEDEESITKRMLDFKNELQQQEQQLADLSSELKTLKVQYEDKRSELIDHQLKAQTYLKDLENLNRYIFECDAQLQKISEKQLKNHSYLEVLEEECQSLAFDIENLSKTNMKLAEELADKEQYLSLLKDELSELLSQMQTKESQIKEINQKISKIEKENGEARIKIDQIIENEEIVVRDIAERYQYNLRKDLASYLEIQSEDLADLKDWSHTLSVDMSDWKSYHFEKRFPGQVKESKEKLRDYKSNLNRLGEINWQAIEDYEKQKVRHEFLKNQQQELKKSLEDLQLAISHIDEKSIARFMIAFEEVNTRFSKVFPVIFGGGSARLELVGDMNSDSCGVDIIAQPPGKKMQSITLMSGGEKAMTAVSLIFSIFLVKPSPFCLLDEVDAPLDDANVGRFNELLREMSSESQFILITHNKKTMELNDMLYGVTMQEPGVSKAVSVQLH